MGCNKFCEQGWIPPPKKNETRAGGVQAITHLVSLHNSTSSESQNGGLPLRMIKEMTPALQTSAFSP